MLRTKQQFIILPRKRIKTELICAVSEQHKSKRKLKRQKESRDCVDWIDSLLFISLETNDSAVPENVFPKHSFTQTQTNLAQILPKNP